MRNLWLLAAATGALGGLAAAPSAWADSGEHLRTASAELATVARETPAVQAAVEKSKSEAMTVEQRVTNGELLYRTKDYARASVVFSEILAQYPDTPSYPDALWLRGETYYGDHEYLSARRDYRQLVDRGNEPRFQAYYGKALARLIDVSLRIGDLAALDDVFKHLNQVPPAQVDASLRYAEGKAYYARQDYETASRAFSGVPSGTTYGHQALYFRGLIAMKQARPGAAPVTNGADGKPRPAAVNYRPSIEVFRQLTELPADTDEHRHVIDLAWMAIGRLFYEMEQYAQASEAYARVDRDSPEFDTMLYELAWVYVRMGDIQRAERALEVLSVADPTSPYVGDGTLLRADLLLRAGSFDKALQLYQGVRTQYDPMRAKVESFLDQTKDVAVYYDKLSQQQLDILDQNEQLPALAVRWAREAEDGPAAFAVIDDVNQCKTLIKQTQLLVDKLTALTGAANRVRAFPDLLAGEQKALGLINSVTHARLELARALDEDEDESLVGEIGGVRQQRRALMGVVADAPTNSAEFEAREQSGVQQWNVVSQQLTQRTMEVDQLQATVNGLRRMLKDDAQHGVARDPSSLERFQAEIDNNERALKLDRDIIGELRRQLEVGRAQVGVGDSRFQNDATARAEFRDLIEREVQLASAGQGGGSAQRDAQQITPSLRQAREDEDRLLVQWNALETQVNARNVELQAKIEGERASLVSYVAAVDAIENGQGGSRDLVGHVAEKNFVMVRDRLRGIVLRADVGITEQAWEVREEELSRVHNLQTERARQEQVLDEELREVLDDANEPGQTPVK